MVMHLSWAVGFLAFQARRVVGGQGFARPGAGVRLGAAEIIEPRRGPE
jgi:hypothetical protein